MQKKPHSNRFGTKLGLSLTPKQGRGSTGHAVVTRGHRGSITLCEASKVVFFELEVETHLKRRGIGQTVKYFILLSIMSGYFILYIGKYFIKKRH